tara:strand:- start:2421 stop:2810 length:390 start_codon:yes stop_codon:yes gene_type:complete
MEKKQIKIGSNRSFGIVFFIFFLIVSLWPLMNGENIRLWSLVVSIIFLILGIINSKILNPLNSLWFKFGLFLGKIISPIVMGVVFFLVVTPTGIIMRLIGKDLLNLKKNNSSSYWIEKQNENNSMKNQF